MTRQTGFTLIELLVVIAILSIVAASVAIQLGEPLAAARFEDVFLQLETVDGQARSHARRYAAPSHLVIDLDASLVWVAGSPGGPAPPPYQLELPSSVRIARVVTATREIEFGVADLPVSRHGQTPTYAVLLEGTSRRGEWLLLAGVTGDVERIEDEQTIREIFGRIASDGADAD